MAKGIKVKLTDKERVTAHIASLDAGNAEIIEYLRATILSADEQVAEQIKWNSPAFYYKGEMAPFDPKEYKRDIVVINLHRGNILLVFPTGARVGDTNGILEGNYTDGRRMVNIKDMDDARAKTKPLQMVIIDWLKLVER